MADREPISINITQYPAPSQPVKEFLKKLKRLVKKPKNEVKILDEKSICE